LIESKTGVPRGLGLADGYDLKPRYRVNANQFSLAAYLKIYE
jgi:hypothetical protein